MRKSIDLWVWWFGDDRGRISRDKVFYSFNKMKDFSAKHSANNSDLLYGYFSNYKKITKYE